MCPWCCSELSGGVSAPVPEPGGRMGQRCDGFPLRPLHGGIATQADSAQRPQPQPVLRCSGTWILSIYL